MGFTPKICKSEDLYCVLNNLSEMNEDEIIELKYEKDGYVPTTTQKYGFLEFIAKKFHAIFGKPKARRITHITTFILEFVQKNEKAIAENTDNLLALKKIQEKFSFSKSSIKTKFATGLDLKIKNITKNKISEIKENLNKFNLYKTELSENLNDNYILIKDFNNKKMILENKIKKLESDISEKTKKIKDLQDKIQFYTKLSELPTQLLNDYVVICSSSNNKDESSILLNKLSPQQIRDIEDTFSRVELQKEKNRLEDIKSKMGKNKIKLSELAENLSTVEASNVQLSSDIENNKRDILLNELLIVELEANKEIPNHLEKIECQDGHSLYIYKDVLKQFLSDGSLQNTYDKKYNISPDDVVRHFIVLCKNFPSNQIRSFIEVLYGKPFSDNTEELLNVYIVIAYFKVALKELDSGKGIEKIVDRYSNHFDVLLRNYTKNKELEFFINNNPEMILNHQELTDFIFFSSNYLFYEIKNLSSTIIKNVRAMALKLAKMNDDRGTCTLAILDDDKEMIKKLHEEAAMNGIAVSQNFMAKQYYIEKDYDTAAKLFQLAADQNYHCAVNNLGVMYLKGQGVPKNYEKAKELLIKAAGYGNESSKLSLKNHFNMVL